MRLSSAQERIVRYIQGALDKSDSGPPAPLIVDAVAGSGKSLTIIEASRRCPGARFLFLCHSRNVKDRATYTLPNNAIPLTIHEAALRYWKKANPNQRQQKIHSRLTLRDIQQTYPDVTYETFGLTLSLLKNFYQSDRSLPDLSDLPFNSQQPSKQVQHRALALSRDIWFAQQSYDAKTSIPITFESLLKLWTQATATTVVDADGRLTTIDPLGQFDAIFLEEAQDIPPCVLSFITRRSLPVVLFGEAMQSLRIGDADATALSHSSYAHGERVTLHESHRFGPSVAFILDQMRSKSPDDKHTASAGVSGLGASRVFTEERAGAWVREGSPFTYISERADSLFRAAYRASERGLKIAWLDGIMSYQANILLDVCNLWHREKYPWPNDIPKPLTTPRLKPLGSFQEALQMGQKNHDQVLLSFCDFIQQHDSEKLLSIIHSWIEDDEARQQALLRDFAHPPGYNIAMSNVYRAKGHEFERVLISHDLVTPSIVGQWKCPRTGIAVLHRLYTAISRCQHEIALPEALIQHFERHHRNISLTNNDAPLVADTPSSSGHPYWGAHRHALLHMTPMNRSKRQRQPVKHPVTTPKKGALSGHQSVQQRLSSSTQELKHLSVDELRAQLPLSRNRKKARDE